MNKRNNFLLKKTKISERDETRKLKEISIFNNKWSSVYILLDCDDW